MQVLYTQRSRGISEEWKGNNVCQNNRVEPKHQSNKRKKKKRKKQKQCQKQRSVMRIHNTRVSPREGEQQMQMCKYIKPSLIDRPFHDSPTITQVESSTLQMIKNIQISLAHYLMFVLCSPSFSFFRTTSSSRYVIKCILTVALSLYIYKRAYNVCYMLRYLQIYHERRGGHYRFDCNHENRRCAFEPLRTYV